jgi:hypothetical protein
VRQFGYLQGLYLDARSTEYKILERSTKWTTFGTFYIKNVAKPYLVPALMADNPNHIKYEVK